MLALVAAALLALAQPQPLAGKTIVVDPGHNGRNWAHPDEVNRLVDAGTLRKACDTTGTATAGGYSEAAYNLDVARRLARILRGREHVSCSHGRRRRLGPVHHDTRRDRQPRAGRRRDLDPRGRRPVGRARLPRRLPTARSPGSPTTSRAASRRLAVAVRDAFAPEPASRSRPMPAGRPSGPLRPRPAQPLRRAEGAGRDREHAQCGRRTAARVARVPAA